MLLTLPSWSNSKIGRPFRHLPESLEQADFIDKGLPAGVIVQYSEHAISQQ